MNLHALSLRRPTMASEIRKIIILCNDNLYIETPDPDEAVKAIGFLTNQYEADESVNDYIARVARNPLLGEETPDAT
jgi:hypothetical protein